MIIKCIECTKCVRACYNGCKVDREEICDEIIDKDMKGLVASQDNIY